MPLGGKANFNFALRLNGDRRVMAKIYRYQDRERISTELKWSAVLQKNGISIPSSLIDKNGERIFPCEDRFGVLFEYVDGSHPTQTSEELYAIGKTLGKLHRVDTGMNDLPGYYITLQMLSDEMKETTITNRETRQFFEETRDIAREIPFDQLPKSLIHGDLFLDNLLQTREQKLCVLDFEELAWDNCLLDIARCVIGCCIQNDRINLSLVQSLLQGYQCERTLAREESAFLYHYIIYAGLLTAFWRYKEYQVKQREGGSELVRKIIRPVQELLRNKKPLQDLQECSFSSDPVC